MLRSSEIGGSNDLQNNLLYKQISTATSTITISTRPHAPSSPPSPSHPQAQHTPAAPPPPQEVTLQSPLLAPKHADTPPFAPEAGRSGTLGPDTAGLAADLSVALCSSDALVQICAAFVLGENGGRSPASLEGPAVRMVEIDLVPGRVSGLRVGRARHVAVSDGLANSKL